MAAKRNANYIKTAARKIPAVDNKALEEAMNAFIESKTGENMAVLLEKMRNATLLVPAQLPKEPAASKKGQKLKFTPVFVQNPSGDKFLPVYTSAAKLKKDPNYQVILSVPVSEAVRIASAGELDLKGIIVNPSTEKLILHPKFLEKLKEPAAPSQNVKKVQMTREQFIIFARKNTELKDIPGRVYRDREALMAALEDRREAFIYEFYALPYADKIPIPYIEEDFSVMVLDIDEETAVAAVELPSKNSAPGTASSMYIVQNPVTGEIQYFIIVRGQASQSNVLCRVNESLECEELMTAPPVGSEISSILEIIKEEADEKDL